MASSATRNVLTIFLASPSDLNDERHIARQTVDDLNKCIGRTLGWQLELLGWEDTLPGSARPQELINRDLALCDLFIGLLWKRWGQPTGKFTSGFEEEFTIAKNRHGIDGRPEIWMAFKTIDPDLLRDPGDHLKRVIQFKSLREAEKDVLFKEFSDEVEWARLLRNWLLTYVLERSKSSVYGVTPAVEVATSTTTGRYATSIEDSEFDGYHLSSQVQDLFERIGRCKDGYPFATDSSGDNLITSFHISRLYLLASTWFSITERRKLLETYSVNALYQSRRNLQATSYEADLILRTIFADKFDLVPGWYWFQGMDKHGLQSKIYQILADDENEDIKVNVLDLMSEADLVLPCDDTIRMKFIKQLLENPSEQIQQTALRYLQKRGLQQDLEVLDGLDKLESLSAESRSFLLEAKVAICCRKNPDEGFVLVLSEKDGSSKPLDVLSVHANTLSKDLLRRALQHTNRQIRHFAAIELFKRGDVADDCLDLMLMDTYTKVLQVGYQEQIRRGIKLDFDKLQPTVEPKSPQPLGLLSFAMTDTLDLEELTRQYYGTLSSGDLIKELDWFSPYGHVAYEILATKYFPLVADRIRKDLGDEFNSLETESVAAILSKYAPTEGASSQLIREALAKMLADHKEGVRSTKTRQFAAAAFAGITTQGIKSDADLARKYLAMSESYDEPLRLEGIKILEEFGDESDVAMLMTIAMENNKTVRPIAVRAALKLSSYSGTTADTLINSENAFLVSSGLRFIFSQDRTLAVTRATELLASSSEATRNAALWVLSEKLLPSEMESVLENYLKRPQYYYNVVCWLDRCLFADVLKSTYLSRLEKEITS